MAEEWPKIRSRRTIAVSQWMDVIAREVEFTAGAEPQIYHAVSQLDYLAVVAVTPDGRIPIVRQYRPAVETFTWELPAGLIERGEEPAVGLRPRTFWRKPAIRRSPSIRSARPRPPAPAGSATASIRFLSRPANVSPISRPSRA